MTGLCVEYEIICGTTSEFPNTEQQQTRKRKRIGSDGSGIEKRTCSISAAPHQQEGYLQLDHQRGEINPSGVPEAVSHHLTSVPCLESSPQRGDGVNGRGESADNNSIQVLLDAVQHLAASPGNGLLDLDPTTTPKEADPFPGEPGLYGAGWDNFEDLAGMLGEPQLYGNG